MPGVHLCSEQSTLGYSCCRHESCNAHAQFSKCCSLRVGGMNKLLVNRQHSFSSPQSHNLTFTWGPDVAARTALKSGQPASSSSSGLLPLNAATVSACMNVRVKFSNISSNRFSSNNNVNSCSRSNRMSKRCCSSRRTNQNFCSV